MLKEPSPSKIGYVYILSSPNTEFIKIGGSDYPPLKRIREINTTEPYKSLGPWSLVDFRQVSDWRKAENFLHYAFRSKVVNDVEKQKELFRLPTQIASSKLDKIDPSEIIGKPKIDRMFQDAEFSSYLLKLFIFTGLLNWLECQGAWTFVLFPSTGGGRYYTINIGPHEVAFSTLPKKDQEPEHMILMDKLILDFPSVTKWVEQHDGQISFDQYVTALPRSAAVGFLGSFNEVNNFLALDGVRRAIVAYWSEALIELKERATLSGYARHHNWNAVAEIHRRSTNGPALDPQRIARAASPRPRPSHYSR